MWLWKSGPLPAGDPLARGCEQRPKEAVDLFGVAVVGVQSDVDRALLGHDVGELGQRDRADHAVLDGRAGGELAAAGRDLDDAVGLGLGEPAQGGVQALR